MPKPELRFVQVGSTGNPIKKGHRPLQEPPLPNGKLAFFQEHTRGAQAVHEEI